MKKRDRVGLCFDQRARCRLAGTRQDCKEPVSLKGRAKAVAKPELGVGAYSQVPSGTFWPEEASINAPLESNEQGIFDSLFWEALNKTFRRRATKCPHLSQNQNGRLCDHRLNTGRLCDVGSCPITRAKYGLETEKKTKAGGCESG